MDAEMLPVPGRPGRRREAVRDRDRYRAERDPVVQASCLEAVNLAERMAAGTFNPLGFFVYLLHDADRAAPFYVGQTTNLFTRLGQHYAAHGERIHRVGVIRCSDRREMSRTEMDLIHHYRPLLNRAGVA